MELPEGIDWPASVHAWAAEEWQSAGNGNYVLKLATPAITDLIDMVRRFYWQRNELLRLSTAYPAVMKEKLEADWEKRR